MQVGFNWLFETFPFLRGKVDTMWQIDPFGSSSNTPIMFGSEFKHIVLNRIGDNIKDKLKDHRSMDFWWYNPNNKDQGMLAHVLNIHYQTEQKYFFENMVADSGLLQEPVKRIQFLRDFILGPRLNDSNSNDIMMLIGDDFEYRSTSKQFQTQDLIYHLVKNYSKEALGIEVNPIIATPKDYFDAINKKIKS